MRRFSGFASVVAALSVLFLLVSCVPKFIPFVGGEEEVPEFEGFVPLTSSGLSTTKDIRADVVRILMDKKDIEILKRNIRSLGAGEKANWTNKDTGNVYTVRMLEVDGDVSRKFVVWGRKKEDTETMVKTYRYYFQKS